jgi:hypothetical protein
VPRNGHADSVPQCPLSGASRKHVLALSFSGFGPILLQKSKIERPGESRESRFLDAPAVARLSGANTKVGGRFGMKGCGPSCRHTRNASAVFKIFVLHPKKTFATISANSGHRPAMASVVYCLLGEQWGSP